jgi:hypothetical protein
MNDDRRLEDILEDILFRYMLLTLAECLCVWKKQEESLRGVEVVYIRYVRECKFCRPLWETTCDKLFALKYSGIAWRLSCRIPD